MADWLTLPLQTQISLATGYASYILAYADTRRAHQPQDAIFLSFAFGAIALLTLALFSQHCSILVSSAAAVGLTLLSAILWRKVLRTAVFGAVNRLRIHQDDGVHDSWSALLNSIPRRSATQISVHTSDGRVLYCNDLTRFTTQPLRGLYLGTDGGITMVVEEEELADGTLESRAGIEDPDWGARMTYLPPSAINRVNLRFGGKSFTS